MKRKMALLLALLLSLSLSGCVKPTEEENRGFDSTRSFSHYIPQVMAAETPDMVYFLEFSDAYLKYVDKASGISGVLCGKPECRHQDKECNGYLSAKVDALLVNGGRLYWVAMKPGGGGQLVCSAALDGTDRRNEAELPQELMVRSSGNHEFVLHNGWLYYSCKAKGIVDGAEKRYNTVTALPLDANKEPVTILDEELPYYYYGGTLLIQFYDGYLYILTTAETEPHDPEDEDAVPLYDLRLRRWDPESGQMETLYEEGGSELCDTFDLWVTDDAVFFNRSTPAPDIETRIYRYDFAAGTCERLFDNGIYGWINMAMIADDLVSGCRMLPQEDGSYQLRIVLKDFEGDVLVDDTYPLELAEEFAQSWYPFLSFLGRDEDCAYYAYSGFFENGDTSLTYVSIITVALDGSGAKVLCTQAEEWAYKNGGA